jgi:hypothetical protein
MSGRTLHVFLGITYMTSSLFYFYH